LQPGELRGRMIGLLRPGDRSLHFPWPDWHRQAVSANSSIAVCAALNCPFRVDQDQVG